jgi:hypothetical protein
LLVFNSILIEIIIHFDRTLVFKHIICKVQLGCHCKLWLSILPLPPHTPSFFACIPRTPDAYMARAAAPNAGNLCAASLARFSELHTLLRSRRSALRRTLSHPQFPNVNIHASRKTASVFIEIQPNRSAIKGFLQLGIFTASVTSFFVFFSRMQTHRPLFVR